MPISPETQPLVHETPETIDVPKFLQSEMQKVETAFTDNVKDDKGNPIIGTPSNQSAKIQLPGDKVTLIAKTKGSITNAATWLYAYLLRMLLKKEANASSANQ